jgi:UDP-N-acetylmuramoylalanine--D-glutamate ligase
VIADALRSYRPLRHRLERFHESAGIHFVDDSKATNPHAAAAGLRATEGPVVLLAGGCDKGLPLDAFSELVRERARRVILFGAAAPSFARAIGKGASVAEVATLEEAVTAARACARAGDTVLLSPACSSFDAYDSYAQRGEAFQRLVRQAFSDRSSRGAGQ